MAQKDKYPMWHIRFVNARNHLSEAAMEMEQAQFEDNDNPAFKALYVKIHSLCARADRQMMRNIERGRKEGWAAK